MQKADTALKLNYLILIHRNIENKLSYKLNIIIIAIIFLHPPFILPPFIFPLPEKEKRKFMNWTIFAEANNKSLYL